MHCRRLGFLLMYALRNVCRASSSEAAFVHQSRAFSVLTRPVAGHGTTATASTYRSSVGLLGRYVQLHRKCRSLVLTERSLSHQDSIFAEDQDFAALGVQTDVLLHRLERLGLERPTAVQSAAYNEIRESRKNVTIGAETGSGKTLAYLLPLMDDILKRKSEALGEDGVVGDIGYDYARAIILVPNKELVQQVVRMAVPLAGGTSSLIYGGSTLVDPSVLGKENAREKVLEHEQVRMAIFPGGLDDPMDFQPFRSTLALGGKNPPVDLVIATPAAVGPLGLKPKCIEMFADISTLVVDEADMLLDGGYIRALENVLLGFRRADRLESSLGVSKTQHVFVAATLPDYGLRSVDAYLQKKFPDTTRVTLAGMHQARHSGLAQQTVWIAEASKQDRMKHLVKLLNEPVNEGGLEGEKVMVFLNSVDDVEGVCQALQRAGIIALPYHAKMRLNERTTTLDRFRQYDKDGDNNEEAVSILICSDLAARGIDVPNVDAVVQLQFAGNVVAHLHRMGRCGRAGQKTGRGIVFYDEQTEGSLVKVVQDAESQQERMVLEGSEVLEVDPETDEAVAGSVNKAFSRKRGFTKKLKKLRKETEQQP